MRNFINIFLKSKTFLKYFILYIFFFLYFFILIKIFIILINIKLHIITNFSNSQYKDQSLWVLLNYFNQNDILNQDSINYELVDTNLVDFYNPINNWNTNELIEDNRKLEKIYSKFEDSTN